MRMNDNDGRMRVFPYVWCSPVNKIHKIGACDTLHNYKNVKYNMYVLVRWSSKML